MYRTRKKNEKLELKQQQYEAPTSDASASHDITSKNVIDKINAVSVTIKTSSRSQMMTQIHRVLLFL
jgi:hypothetical protein